MIKSKKHRIIKSLRKRGKSFMTRIFTGFVEMGKILAQMILSGKKGQIENKSELIIRKSL